MSWLDRAQRNTLGVGAIVYVPTDHDRAARPVDDYKRGIDLGMGLIQMWYWKHVGKTFRTYPCVTVNGTVPAAQFEHGFGMYEGTAHILDTAAAQRIYVGGRLVDKGDERRVWVSFAIAPLGWIGGTIGIDNYRMDAEDIPTWPWPGRTGLQGWGLELMAMNYPQRDTPPEAHADESREWWGAIAHELGHCFCGLPHPTDWADADTIMLPWWRFLAYPAVGLREGERAALRASPFFR